MTLPILVLIAGLILYFFFSTPRFSQPQVSECGRIMFFVGLLVTVLDSAGVRVF